MKFEIGLSQPAYAKRRGCDPSAVREAIKSGHIAEAVLPDKTIDADLADRLWEANTDPTQRRGKEAERADAAMRAAETVTQASPSETGRDSPDEGDGEDPVPTPPPRRKETFEEDPPRFRPSADIADALEEHLRRNRGEDDEGDDEDWSPGRRGTAGTRPGSPGSRPASWIA